MGATNFSTVNFGKTANDAFQAAQQEARYEYGNEGYTGSIAEKSDFAHYATPKGASFKAMVTWLLAATEARYYDEQAEFAPIAADRAPAARTAKKHWNKIPAAHRALATQMAECHDDKWGPAVCIEMTGKAAADMRTRCGLKGRKGTFYYFAGLASE